ncbi:FHA domain-containing protein, partial [Microbacterium sp. CPCC 204701]|uniref:FHA domain-containing protein n=1 Tax=Microbacterium sp. CPCC 204701 TaxID=2493084 RepID=UPI0013E39609
AAYAPPAAYAPAPAAYAPAPAPAAFELVPAGAALAEDVERTRVAAAVPPPAQRAALYPDAPVLAVLTWDDGTRMAVYGRTLYGRNPAGEAGAVTVAVRDETLSLSKTHFEVGSDERGPWIVDRHSTNGTVLVRDGGRLPLVPGVRTTLRDGDRLDLGDRSTTVGVI